jgi:outer membrane protein assembly factor BamD (BamD/ComL family)
MPRALSIAIGLLMILGVLGGFGWGLWHCLKNSDDPPKLIFKWIVTFLCLVLLVWMAWGLEDLGRLAMPFVAVAIGIAMSILWAPNIGAVLAKPFTSMFDGGDQEIEPQPLYSIAIAKRKAGKYQEAVYEVHKQLERFPNDFQGLLMLAEIQAENLNDLPAAEMTIERLLNQPGHLPGNIALALNELADWRLKYLLDLESARQALQKIVELYPNSEQSHTAAQRLAHLANMDDLMAVHDRIPIHLAAGAQRVGLMKDSSSLRKPADDPATLAVQYVKHLEEHPLDNEAREKLALLYAEHYQRADLAIDQLEQLAQQPYQAPKQVAHWLNLIADLQIRYTEDAEAPRRTLHRIIELYPNLSYADNAQNRLAHLNLQLKGKEKSQPIKLGSYEQNIGLKKR